MKKTKLTEKDYTEFYKAMLYGDLSDPLKVAIKTAYLDLCRTISGFSKNSDHDDIIKNAKDEMKKVIKELLHQNITEQGDFDEWHKWACDKLIKSFRNQKLTYGQAQKWINMTLKYLSMFDHEKVEKVYEYCHMPIDSYIIEAVGEDFKTKWSKIESYEQYFNYQKMLRNKYENKILIDVEFYMWINEKRKRY